MIIAGNEYQAMIQRDEIHIKPFLAAHVNPNSYNYHLGAVLIQLPGLYSDDLITIPDEGMILNPGHLYLGHTLERIGSRTLTTSLIGRSSVGRLGLFVQVDADLGQLGAIHQWTLELRPVLPVRIYAGMEIGQVSFWETTQTQIQYSSGYAAHDLPTVSRASRS